jgi:hypothetical protein
MLEEIVTDVLERGLKFVGEASGRPIGHLYQIEDVEISIMITKGLPIQVMNLGVISSIEYPKTEEDKKAFLQYLDQQLQLHLEAPLSIEDDVSTRSTERTKALEQALLNQPEDTGGRRNKG